MKRLFLVAALAVASSFASVPASAGPSGDCDGKVDVACRPSRCQPDMPCTIEFCLIWTGSKCGIN